MRHSPMTWFKRAALATLTGLLAVLGSAPLVEETSSLAAAATGFVQAPALPGAQPITARDRVYTADQTSNTVTVISPATNEVETHPKDRRYL